MSIDLGQPKQRAWRNWQATTERTPLEGEAGTPLGAEQSLQFRCSRTIR